jgi:hypothetical protein
VAFAAELGVDVEGVGAVGCGRAARVSGVPRPRRSPGGRWPAAGSRSGSCSRARTARRWPRQPHPEPRRQVRRPRWWRSQGSSGREWYCVSSIFVIHAGTFPAIHYCAATCWRRLSGERSAQGMNRMSPDRGKAGPGPRGSGCPGARSPGHQMIGCRKRLPANADGPSTCPVGKRKRRHGG